MRDYRLPRAVLVEDEYQLAMLRAERDWVRKLVPELESGELAWSYPELEHLQADLGGDRPAAGGREQGPDAEQGGAPVS